MSWGELRGHHWVALLALIEIGAAPLLATVSETAAYMALGAGVFFLVSAAAATPDEDDDGP